MADLEVAKATVHECTMQVLAISKQYLASIRDTNCIVKKA